MSLLTINAAPIIKGAIYMPRVGIWHADMTIDQAAGITGAVTIATADGSFSLAGTVIRQGIFQDTLSMRILGGAGGLVESRILPAKSYQSSTIGTILTDTLRACGETLSPRSDRGVLGTVQAKWTRIAGNGKRAIARLLQDVGASWRMLADGSVWVGVDTYPAAPDVQFDVIDRWFGDGRIVIGSHQPFLFPGTTLTISSSATQGAQRVSYVTHEIEAGSVTAEVWFEAA